MTDHRTGIAAAGLRARGRAGGGAVDGPGRRRAARAVASPDRPDARGRRDRADDRDRRGRRVPPPGLDRLNRYAAFDRRAASVPGGLSGRQAGPRRGRDARQPPVRPPLGGDARRDADGAPAVAERARARVASVPARGRTRESAAERDLRRPPTRRRDRRQAPRTRAVLSRPRARPQPDRAGRRPDLLRPRPALCALPRPPAGRGLSPGRLLRPARVLQPRLRPCRRRPPPRRRLSPRRRGPTWRSTRSSSRATTT